MNIFQTADGPAGKLPGKMAGLPCFEKFFGSLILKVFDHRLQDTRHVTLVNIIIELCENCQYSTYTFQRLN